MSGIIFLLFSGLGPMPTLVGAPATQPSTRPEAARVPDAAKLIAELDDPRFQRRKEATRRLIELGPEVLPQLETASRQATAEAAARLREVMTEIRRTLRGALVVCVITSPEAMRMRIEPGDVVMSINGTRVENAAEYKKRIETIGLLPIRMQLLTAAGTREVLFPAGTTRIQVDDYTDEYGRELRETLAAFWNGNMREARAGFKRAFAAGLRFRRNANLELMYATTLYGCGDPEGAYRILEGWVTRAGAPAGWASMVWIVLNYPCSSHLSLRAMNKALEAYPSYPYMQLLAARLRIHLWRPDQAFVTASKLISLPREELGATVEDGAMQVATIAMGCLDQEPHFRRLAHRLKNLEGYPYALTHVAGMANRFDLRELELWAGEESLRRARLERYVTPKHLRNCFSSLMEAQRLKDATDLVKELKPSERSFMLEEEGCTGAAWPEARPVIAEVVRLTLRHPDPTRPSLSACIRALLRQSQPDVGLIEELMQRLPDAKEPPPEIWPFTNEAKTQPRGELPFYRSQLAMIRGDYAAAADLLANEDVRTRREAYARAAAFLKEHAAALGREREKWRNTVELYPLADNSRLLITRDYEVGLCGSDLSDIRAVPLPAAGWWRDSLHDSLIQATAGGPVYTPAGRWLCRFTEPSGEWTRVAEFLGETQVEEMTRFAEHIGSIEDHLSIGGRPALLLVPERDEKTPRIESLLKPDGTWVSCDLRTGRVWFPRQLAQTQISAELEIYHLRPADEACERVYAFSSEGLLLWKPFEAIVERLPLPDETQRLAVVPTNEGGRPGEGFEKLGLMPTDGGTTYLLNLKTGEVTREGCINEDIPVTYWHQRSQQQKREQVQAALREAQVEWPWADEAKATD